MYEHYGWHHFCLSSSLHVICISVCHICNIYVVIYCLFVLFVFMYILLYVIYMSYNLSVVISCLSVCLSICLSCLFLSVFLSRHVCMYVFLSARWLSVMPVLLTCMLSCTVCMYCCPVCHPVCPVYRPVCLSYTVLCMYLFMSCLSVCIKCRSNSMLYSYDEQYFKSVRLFRTSNNLYIGPQCAAYSTCKDSEILIVPAHAPRAFSCRLKRKQRKKQ